MNENRRYITLVALIVALGGFLMGFDASVISGVVKFIEPEFGLTKLELGWAVSSLTLTSTLAMLVVGPISDRVGRKKILSYAAIIYTISAIGSAFAPSFWVLVVARMIGGLGVGASLIIAPMYIAEIAPAKLRGRLVSFNQLNIVIGISTAFFTNYLILQLGKSDASWAQNLNFDIWNWRWMLGLEAVPAIIYFFALFVVPRSPRWLIMKGKEELALEIMQKAVGSAKATTDLQDIRNSIQQDKNKAKASFKDIFKPAVRTVLVIGIVIAILQQITGINSVFFYAPMIFEQAGLGTDAAFTQAIFVGLINLVFTLLAIAFIDRFGRKPLLMFGLSGITISMMVLAFGFHSATYKLTPELQNTLPEIINENMIVEMSDKTYNSEEEFLENAKVFIAQEDITKHEEVLINKSIQLNTGLILFGILAFVASFAVSIGPVMWVLFSELFPNSIRAITISFVGFINSAISFLVQLVFPWELENFGSPLTFFIYGAFAFLGLLFIIRKVPETKGKSLEELEEILTKK